MAFKLNKGQLSAKNSLEEDLRTAKSSLESAVEQANEAIAEHVAAVNAAVTHYNGVLETIKTFVEERKDEWQTAFDAKSESWQETGRGEAALSLIEEWGGFEADELEECSIDAIEVAAEHLEAFEGLPTEAE
jgi:hypothetical protein